MRPYGDGQNARSDHACQLIDRKITVVQTPDTPNDLPAARPFLGVYDYSYAPYSLGDTVTWQMNVLVSAVEAGANAIDHVLVVDPRKPACWMQPHIDSDNYRIALQNIFPAFLCSPLLRSFRLFRDRAAFDLYLVSNLLDGHKTHPTVANHLQRRMGAGGFVSTRHGGFPLNHSMLNAFHRKRGYLPRLCAPRGYRRAAADFLMRRAADKIAVAVHVRQSKLSSAPASLHRDSVAGAWLGFFRSAAVFWPDVVFLVLGGYDEWERPLLFLDNVVIPRTHGLGLAHELALLHQADLFMGASSGFSAMATFSTVPYVIFNMEHDFAQYNDVPVGEPRYPFALANQSICWEAETTPLLLDFFDRAHRGLRERRSSAPRAG